MSRQEIVTGPFKKSSQFLTKGMHFIGDQLIPGSPFDVSPEKVEDEEGVRRYAGGLAVATGVMEAGDPETRRDRAGLIVQLMVNDRLMTSDTRFLEVRPLAPGDEFWGTKREQDYSAASRAITDTVQAKYNIPAASYPAPITPTAHEDSPVDPESVALVVGAEMESFGRHSHEPKSRRLLLALGERAYAQWVFSEPPEGFEVATDLDESPLLIMQPARAMSGQGQLLPPEPPKLLEAGSPESTRQH